MLSVYSGMDMNFTQSFPTPFGLARSRVGAFDLQEASRQQQQSSPPPSYPTTNVSSSVSLVEPMLQSSILVDSTAPPPLSSSPSASFMYYDSYSSPFLPNTTVASSGTTNVSVSSLSLDDSWEYASLSTDLLPETYHSHTFMPSCEQPPSSQQQPYLFLLDMSSYLPPPPPLTPSSQHQYHQVHEKQLLYPSSSGVQICDSVPNFLSSHGSPYQQDGRSINQVYDGLSSSQTPVIPSAIVTSPTLPNTTITNSSQRPNKRKRTQSSSPMPYSKPGRSLSMSPSCGNATNQQGARPSKQLRQSHVGSLSPKSEQGCITSSSGSITYSPMNMISSFPTKVNVSSNTSTKRYECHICSKKFTRPSSLTTHIYSHTKEKPFKCPVEGCGRHFSVVSNLRRHAKIHSSPSNPKC